MSDAATSPNPVVYQLRVVMVGISPLIWRRLLIPADTTIAGLHTVLQTAFGWGGEHLHRFIIHGTEYGISSVGGSGFRDDARQVRLGELGLRLGERFTYEYNYFADWTCDLRVEQIPRAQPGRTYPRCVGGRRAGPPEDCGGPWAFLEQTQAHLVLDATLRTAECLDCGAPRRHKDSRPIVMKTLFGRLRLDSPRWWHCGCQPRANHTFSPLA
jgi:pRiA4b ORF-3-like protein